MLPERTRHLAFGDVAAVWGMLAELGVAAIIDEVAGSRPAGAAAVRGHLPGAGGAEPAGRPVLEARVRGLVEDHRGGPVHQDPGLGAGSPPVLGRDARRHPGGSWRRSAAASRRGSCAESGLDCSSVALDMTNFATFIATANGKAPIAQRGKAKQKRTDLRLVGPGPGGHPRRRDPADLARLPRRPARRHPVRHDDRPAASPSTPRSAPPPGSSGRGHDGGLRRRAELRGQLRPPRRNRAALHRLGARLGLPGPDRPARQRPDSRRRRPVRRADRLRHPPRGLRHRAARDLDPLTRAARSQARGFTGTTLAKAGTQAGRAGRHPGPRQDPPTPQQGRSRDRGDHPQALGPPRHRLAAGRRPAQGPAADLAHRPQTPAPRWKTNCSASTC